MAESSTNTISTNAAGLPSEPDSHQLIDQQSLLSLPAEIRLQIYHALLPDDEPQYFFRISPPHWIVEDLERKESFLPLEQIEQLPQSRVEMLAVLRRKKVSYIQAAIPAREKLLSGSTQDHAEKAADLEKLKRSPLDSVSDARVLSNLEHLIECDAHFKVRYSKQLIRLGRAITLDRQHDVDCVIHVDNPSSRRRLDDPSSTGLMSLSQACKQLRAELLPFIAANCPIKIENLSYALWAGLTHPSFTQMMQSLTIQEKLASNSPRWLLKLLGHFPSLRYLRFPEPDFDQYPKSTIELLQTVLQNSTMNTVARPWHWYWEVLMFAEGVEMLRRSSGAECFQLVDPQTGEEMEEMLNRNSG